MPLRLSEVGSSALSLSPGLISLSSVYPNDVCSLAGAVAISPDLDGFLFALSATLRIGFVGPARFAVRIVSSTRVRVSA